MAPARVSVSDSEASSGGDVSMTDANAGATRESYPTKGGYTPVSPDLSLGHGLARL